ncbi:MAG: hypothetical protein WDZ41_01235 [Candidatus Babeliales bacterium]
MKKYYILLFTLFSVNFLQAQIAQLSNSLNILEQNLIQFNKLLNNYIKTLPKPTPEEKDKEEERKRKEQEELELKQKEQEEREQKEKEKQELERKREEERKRKEKEKKEPVEAKEFLNAIKTQAYPEIQNIEKTDILNKDQAIQEFINRINEYINKKLTLNDIVNKYHESLMQLKDDIAFKNYLKQYRHFSQLVISNIANQFDDDGNYKGYLNTDNKFSADTMSIFRKLIEMNKKLLVEYPDQNLQYFINRYDRLQNLYELSVGLPPTVSRKISTQLKVIIENLEKQLKVIIENLEKQFDQAKKALNTLTETQKQETLEKIQLYQQLKRRILGQINIIYRDLFKNICSQIKCQIKLEDYDFKSIQRQCFKELKNLNNLQRQFSLRPESFNDQQKKEIQERIEAFVQKCTPSKLIKEFYQELGRKQITPSQEEEPEEEPEVTLEQKERFEELEAELIQEAKKNKTYTAPEKVNLINKIKQYKELAYQVDEPLKKAIISFETQLRLQR